MEDSKRIREHIRTLTVKQLAILRLLGMRPRARVPKAHADILRAKGLIVHALDTDGVYRWHLPKEVGLAYLAYVDSMRNWNDEDCEELENRT